MLKVNEGLATQEEADAFFEVMKMGDIETLRRFVERNPKLLKWQTARPTLLHLAAEMYPVATVKYLLSVGFAVNANPDENVKAGYEYTPLCYAAGRMNRITREEMVRFLVENGANVNAGAGKNSTPLHNLALTESPELIHYLMDHGADARFEDQEGRTPLAVAIEFKSPHAEAALRERGAPLTGIPIAARRRSKKTKSVRVDLRRDAKKIGDYIRKRVDEQVKKSPDAPVKRIDLGFGYCEDAFVALYFDTRPNAEPDGEWAQAIDEELGMEMAQWGKAAEALGEKPVHLVLPDGSKQTVSTNDKDFNDEALVALLGDMLKNGLLSARAEGVFEPLRKAERCELGVEELEGNYGWPAYEDRGKENLA